MASHAWSARWGEQSDTISTVGSASIASNPGYSLTPSGRRRAQLGDGDQPGMGIFRERGGAQLVAVRTVEPDAQLAAGAVGGEGGYGVQRRGESAKDNDRAESEFHDEGRW